MEKSVKLTEEELAFIRTGSTDYNKIKVSLGELELQKQSLFIQAEKIITAFNDNEKVLVDKYGADSVINMQTGEVTKKKEEKEKKE
jgi:hypothetical protein|tara:strand:+ start:181 stop:438 length:258 start_codon:yes stop_codon:yes gene_type:complete